MAVGDDVDANSATTSDRNKSVGAHGRMTGGHSRSHGYRGMSCAMPIREGRDEVPIHQGR